MIVPMKHVTVLATENSRDDTLAKLQELGLLHLNISTNDAPDLRQADASVNEAKEALQLIAKAAEEQSGARMDQVDQSDQSDRSDQSDQSDRSDQSDQQYTISSILGLAREAEELAASATELNRELAQLAPFGDFDPATVRQLAAEGIPIELFRCYKDNLPTAQEGGFVHIVAHEGSDIVGIAVGSVDISTFVERISLPEQSTIQLRRQLVQAISRQSDIQKQLASYASRTDTIESELARRADLRDFVEARLNTASTDGILWMTGFCPAEKVNNLTRSAAANGWGLSVREPSPDEEPPTIIRPPRGARAVTDLFKMLGILPGYRETDISVAFYAFFTIFFAMLVGDAGYGAIMLLATLAIHRHLKRKSFHTQVSRHTALSEDSSTKPLSQSDLDASQRGIQTFKHSDIKTFSPPTSSPFVLMGIFSSATILWGVLSANYFGIPPESLPPSLAFLNHGIARWLGKPDNSNIMRLCFAMGAAHLSLARIWNAVELFPSRKALSEIGWVGVIWTMYAAACSVSVAGFVFPPYMFAVAIVSILLIAFFMLDRSEFKTRGIDLGMLPLNIISCLGDVISYVRLFAVGMASLEVAKNFNMMAFKLALPIWAKIPIVILILLAGHGLNLLMGALSILVHGVRLNTLEFSNHKGIGWSGFAYKPFQHTSKTIKH